MDDTTQVEWSFVGIESPYCQGRHSPERTTIYAYNIVSVSPAFCNDICAPCALLHLDAAAFL